ncbi:pirin family protein [Phenylobacterium montanum]|uniref:Pirin family protein n=1 Tax=Phenylobacterium montanum TaxID=2823693 RepID=A0A975G1U8_9CAUL|nr:pirin family protein [Caulobacter sp. S6]QUD89570.1 pirin family protein [Caulobacter sp. S6]
MNLRTLAQVGSLHRQGPITRLISPEDLGEALKPFIFLDYFAGEISPGFGFPMHPHSGIATLTWQPGCDVRYRDTTGKDGTLKAGGLEWMNAGGGAWHQGVLLGQGRVMGFQLWVAMPPGVESGPPLGQYVAPTDVPILAAEGVEIKLFLGHLRLAEKIAISPITSHQVMNYFTVSLAPGVRWRYAPPVAHDVAWAFDYAGDVLMQGARAPTGGVKVFASSGDMQFEAGSRGGSILVGSAVRHPHPLVIGPSSVHTSREALDQGLAQIESAGSHLPAALEFHR